MLSRTIFQIYGPICIYSYGLMIAIGVVCATYLLLKDKRRASLIDMDTLLNILSLGTLVGIAGGRILHVISSPQDISSFWHIFALYEGGFSILGTVIAILLFIPWHLKRIAVPILPFFDLIASYAPLIQSISRIGCFFAGCCFGAPAELPWCITYTDPDTLAPLHCTLHPTQLYAATSLLVLFLFLQWVARRFQLAPGQLSALYLALFSAQRLCIDFFRGDRIMHASELLSFHQWIALGLCIASLSAYYLLGKRTRRTA